MIEYLAIFIESNGTVYADRLKYNGEDYLRDGDKKYVLSKNGTLKKRPVKGIIKFIGDKKAASLLFCGESLVPDPILESIRDKNLLIISLELIIFCSIEKKITSKSLYTIHDRAESALNELKNALGQEEYKIHKYVKQMVATYCKKSVKEDILLETIALEDLDLVKKQLKEKNEIKKQIEEQLNEHEKQTSKSILRIERLKTVLGIS